MIMKKLKSILIQYRLLLVLFTPLVVIFAIYQAWKNRDRQYLKQRLGFFGNLSYENSVWIHAASVGEVNAVMPLINILHQRDPKKHIILSTGTPTGGQVARGSLPENCTQVYLPFDWKFSVKRYLKAIKPCCAIIMETELWPTLYDQCASKDIPIVIINGRVSEKTTQTNAWMYKLYSETLEKVSMIYARSEHDANGFITIGAPSSRIKVLGNIKFAQENIIHTVMGSPISRPFVLAASTHDDEEFQISKLWQSISHSKQLLVIAPRHPQRLNKILKQLKPLHLNIAIRSRGDDIGDSTDVYIVDTLGELVRFIANAELVFMGGSLVPKGGHNIIEVARFAKPLIFGPYMDNFYDEAALFLDNRAAIQVNSWGNLAEVLPDLLQNPEQGIELGKNAEMLLKNLADIANRYAEKLSAIV